ncbi:MAG: aldehyde dehydrogenase family protein [Planctomycetes bacterium]|nr:aldehyde dehydrogenase family protein [Planctomycetota bacterium]
MCPLAGPDEVRSALDANVAAMRACRDLPAHERAAALRRVADAVDAARGELARTMALEGGKPIALALLELSRTAHSSSPPCSWIPFPI